VLVQDPGFREAAVVGRTTSGSLQRWWGTCGAATRRVSLVCLVAVPLVLAGCATTRSPATLVAATSPSSDPSAAAAAQYASNTPPAAAQMVCSDEIRSLVTDFLGLDSVPAPEAAYVG
jgi:hypothetical protein